LTGSRETYEPSGRHPWASVNFITSHDGFTLNDLVSYNEKHNEANGENNMDGENNNLSWNCGVEGPTEDPAICALRERQERNFLATLLLSQGVPMIHAGDECGRSQGGNNNAYCQDNEISWFRWEWDDADLALFDFTRRLIAIRREFPVLHRRKFFQGRSIHGSEIQDIRWISPTGADMTEEEWANGRVRVLGMLLNGAVMDESNDKGEHIEDDILLMLVNGYWGDVPFRLPGQKKDPTWKVLVDTASPNSVPVRGLPCGQRFTLKARSLVLLRQPRPEPEQPPKGGDEIWRPGRGAAAVPPEPNIQYHYLD
jgi:glycogen operon protein